MAIEIWTLRLWALRMTALAGALAATLLFPTAAAQSGSDTFSDCDHCPIMVMVPAGEFLMGSKFDKTPTEPPMRKIADAENLTLVAGGTVTTYNTLGPLEVPPLQPWQTETPQRRVSVAAFAAGKYEVTRAEYAVFAASRKKDTVAGDRGCGALRESGTIEYRFNNSWANPGFPTDDTHPAVCVSWEDATDYVEWLSKETGKKYRLLSEAEWEYAARAGTVSTYWWGNEASQHCAHANGADFNAANAFSELGRNARRTTTCNDGSLYTAPVGSFAANPFGLHDMMGNAAEWVWDCWTFSYVGAREDATPRLDGACNYRVVRGGSWYDSMNFQRSARRSLGAKEARVGWAGFRVAREL